MREEKRPRSVEGVLLLWMRDVCYHLNAPDDHVVELWHKERKVAVYPQTVGVDQLRDDIKKDYLEQVRRIMEE